MSPELLESARVLLCRLQDFIRDRVLEARARTATEDLCRVATITQADTIYHIDRIGEQAIVEWFTANWPSDLPVEVVMEGIEDDDPLTFPRGTTHTAWKCILDPIDGTRNLMYDKRPAWTLAGLAPQRGRSTHVGDIVVAAMTELPTTKHWASDQFSGTRGCGPDGLVAERVNVLDGRRSSLRVSPSPATTFLHGFASLARFFPEGKALLAQVEEEIWRELYGGTGIASLMVFDDQYISTGGQIYELLVGHDRMLGDLRPLALRKLGNDTSLVCHPYDICTQMLLVEAGGIVETPDGSPLRVPLDTTTPVAWMGYANRALAEQVRPILQRSLRHF